MSGMIAGGCLAAVCGGENTLDCCAQVGSQSENELILVNALVTFHDALQSTLRAAPDKRLLLDNFDTLLLAIDELIDGGCASRSMCEPACAAYGVRRWASVRWLAMCTRSPCRRSI